MLMKIVGAGVGAKVGEWAVRKFIFKNTDGGGFIDETEGLGLDDAVLAIGMGLGAALGLSLIGKIGG